MYAMPSSSMRWFFFLALVTLIVMYAASTRDRVVIHALVQRLDAALVAVVLGFGRRRIAAARGRS